VLDTNVLLSGAANSQGVTGAILEAWVNNRFTLLTSNAQIREFKRVTKYPNIQKILKKKLAGRLLNRIKKHAEFIPVRGAKKVSPDPDDDFIIAIATQGQAQFLVSRNKVDLLDLVLVEEVRILTPEQFLRFLRRGRIN
jgi:putative PIN family toxin of toxin-antitoxin system